MTSLRIKQRLQADQPLWKYCAYLTAAITIPGLAFATAAYLLVSLMFPNVQAMHSQYNFQNMAQFIERVILAPAEETLAMILFIYILKLKLSNRHYIAIIIGLFASVIHARNGFLAFIPATWAFILFALAYQTWRPHGFFKAYIASAVPHAINNFIIFSLSIAFSSKIRA